MSDYTLASSIHAMVDWVQERWSERDSWNGVTVMILSLMFVMLSPALVFLAWIGVLYGGWILLTRKGNGTQLRNRDRDRTGP